MCQTNVYAVSEGAEEMLMEGVSRLEVRGDMIVIKGIFGDMLEVKARIKDINFQSGRLNIERLQ